MSVPAFLALVALHSAEGRQIDPATVRAFAVEIFALRRQVNRLGHNINQIAHKLHGTGEIVLPLMDMGLLAPYMSPERKMVADDLKDRKGFWTSVYVNSVVLGYNTNLLKGQVVPRGIADTIGLFGVVEKSKRPALGHGD